MENKRKINRTWEKTETKSLIEEYEARPDLWDPSRPNYQNRNIRQKMLQEIAKTLKLTSEEVSAKLHSLKTQFNRESSREKKQKSGSAGEDVYVSKWEYLSSLKFLNVGSVSGDTISNLDFIESNDSSSISSFEQSSSGITGSTSTSDTQSVSSEPSTSRKRQHSQSASQKNTKRKSSAVDDNMDVLLERAISVMDQRSDEWDIFGQFIASEIRQIFDLVQRNSVKRAIMNILMTSGSLEHAVNGYTSETVFVTVQNDDE